MAAFVPPQVFDEYQLVRLLGQGAMGQVWLGHDTLLDRAVAVKFISALHPDEIARERFFIEARAIARLSHPNVVAIYRVSQVEGLPYLVSEFVRGQSLEKLPRPMGWERALQIGIGVARGLLAAHARGVLHRDVKPANIMMTEDGEVKLLDFGLAKLLDALPRGAEEVGAAAPTPWSAISPTAVTGEAAAAEAVTGNAVAASTPSQQTPDLVATAPFLGEPAEPPVPSSPSGLPRRTSPAASAGAGSGSAHGNSPSLTSAGVLIGTPRYMAPEMWRGEPATAAADIYSLGGILFELLAGRPPHREATLLALCEAVLHQDAPQLATVAPGVPRRLCEIIDRCLSRDPAGRFPSGATLCQALEAQLLRADAAPAAVPEGNPYRGLLAFDAQHRAVFFGRALEVRDILDLLRGQQMVVVAGDSGVGKSSLCRAGVLPLIEEGAFSDGRRWIVARFSPGRRPLSALGAALLPVLYPGHAEPPGAARPTSAPSRPGLGVADLLSPALVRGEPTALLRQLRRLLGERTGLMLFIDQGEELLTQSDPEEAALIGDFLGALNLNLGSPVPGVRALLTARSDFLTRMATLPGLGDGLARALYLLRPLSVAGLREAIVGPARQRGVSFESDALVEELSATTARTEGGLPLLQFALAELWDARDETRHLIPASALSRIGGVAGALSRHADAVIAALPAQDRAGVQRALTLLVTPQGTRARRTAAELPVERGVLEHLVRGRLLFAHESESGEGTSYELAHEALLHGWATLQRWLDESAEQRSVRGRIEAAAAEWERLSRSPEALWAEPQLAEARAVSLSSDALPPREAAFLRGSQRLVRQRRRARVLALVGLPLGLVLTYGGFSLRASYQLGRRVDRHLRAAAPLLGQAHSEAAAAEALARKAFDLFDGSGAPLRHGPARAKEIEAAETTWAESRARAEEAGWHLAQASQELEAATMLDRARGRRQLAEALYQQALLHEAGHRPQLAEELIGRLGSYDDEGLWRRRWVEPALLHVTSRPAGAQLTLVRQENREGRRAATSPLPLPAGGGPVAPGSYVLLLTLPGRPAVRAPLLLRRGERLDLAVPVPPRVPPGMVYVPPGRFLYGSAADEQVRRGFLTASPLHEVTTAGYLIGRHEVRFADWIDYLRALPPEERVRRTPRARDAWGEMSLTEDEGGYRLTFRPTTQVYTARAGEPLRYPGRTQAAAQDWLRMPVAAISWEDALSYTAWLDRSGRLPGARPCDEHEWERAARGADGRTYPHGDVLQPQDADFDATYGRQPLAYGPDEVGRHPASNSPFGVTDMAGNVWEWTRSLGAEELLFRGGSWYQDQVSSQSANRQAGERSLRMAHIGLRVCAPAIE